MVFFGFVLRIMRWFHVHSWVTSCINFIDICDFQFVNMFRCDINLIDLSNKFKDLKNEVRYESGENTDTILYRTFK